MLTFTNIYYFYCISDIGGTETFLYELAKKYKDYDLTIFYRYADEKQLERLKKYVRCVKFINQDIYCEKAFFNYGIDIIEKVHAKEYCFVVHADYEDQLKRGQIKQIPTHPKINRYIAVSQHAAKAFSRISGKKCEVCYNPLEIRKPNKILHLISATRLSREKGKARLIQLMNLLDKANIKYEWTIFTNDADRIENPHIIYKDPKLDILDEIAEADHLVQLSDNESFCYSVVEALCAGTPVLVTPCPVFTELGLRDGKNCYFLPFDMKDVDVNKIYSNIPKFEYQPPQDRWDDLFIHTPNPWPKERDKIYTVKATSAYEDRKIRDGQLNHIPKRGECWQVDYDRMMTLTGQNEKNIVFVTIVEESDLSKE